MTYTLVGSIPVFGEPVPNAVAQMQNCAPATAYCALMADHHLGYALPVGGVAAYRGQVSPSGVGYDISCGNKAVMLDLRIDDIWSHIKTIMDEIWHTLSFGVGLVNDEPVEHPLFHDDPAWDIDVARGLRNLAMAQLGTIGSGNHYVDLFGDEEGRVWVGVHFGSRGLGHRLATHFVKAGGGKDGINVAPVLFDEASQLGQEYIACMNLAGRYAYAGRDWVCNKVAEILGAEIVDEVHNHHNYAWREEHFGEPLWVIRKGATPAWPGQRGFIGGSMGDNAVIVEGVESDESIVALRSTVHGAGRVMSRTQAAGRSKWVRGKQTRVTEGAVSRQMMHDWVDRLGVELRGAGTDEAPQVYKRLPDVLRYHASTIRILHTLTPIGVAMAGEDEADPYKD